MMSVKVTDNTPRVELEMNQRFSLFVRTMLDEIHHHSRPVTPKKYGNLRDDVVKTTRGTKGKIVWDKVYAAVQERGMIKGRPIRNYTTAGTGPKYAEKGVRKAILRAGDTLRKVKLT